ncbi:hypothetical protein TrRE_jg12444, partial [Triparma retinervis]
MATECAGVGVCDYVSGLCTCPLGFTGQACERLACPKDCNGRGTCQTVRNAGFTYGRDLSVAYSSGDGKGPQYNNWDHSSTTMCVCDIGFTGPDCSTRICPKGDDPMTSGQNYREITLETGATSGLLGGYFKFNFQGETVRFSANSSNWTSTQCDSDIESLPNVASVTCVRAAANPARLSANYTIKFIAWPAIPHENNIYSHSGNPNLMDFSCDVSEVAGTAAGAFCKLYDSKAINIREYLPCSGRGICDASTAQCTCSAGFDGVDCQTSSTQVSTATSSDDILLLYSTSGGYTGNALKLKTDRAASTDFNLIYAETNSLASYQLKGNGDVLMHQGGLTITAGGETITAGGLVITAGGQTVTGGGLTVAGGGSTVSGGLVVKAGGQTMEGTDGLHILGGGATIKTTSRTDTGLEVFANGDKRAATSSVFRVRADTNATSDPDSADNFALIEAIIGKYDIANKRNLAANQTIFRVTAQPKTEIHVGGLDVKAGGQTIRAGGLVVTAGGVTISSGDLVLASGTMSTTGFSSSSITTFSAAVNAAGQTLTLTGATVEGAMNFKNGFTSEGVTTFSNKVSLALQTVTLGTTAFKGTSDFSGGATT